MSAVTHLLFLGSIQLSGLPAPRADLTGAYLPLHPQVSRFTASISLLSELERIIVHSADGRFVSALLPRLSPYASRRRGSALWMEFPQLPSRRTGSCPPTRQPSRERAKAAR